MSVASTSTTRRELPSAVAHESYIKHIDASHSVRIIVQSVADERNTIRRGAWRSGLCGSLCGGGDGRAGCATTCCVPWLCPCVSIAQVGARICVFSYMKVLFFFGLIHVARLASIAEVIQQQHDQEDFPSSGCAIALAAFVASSALFSMGIVVMRRQVRSRFEIPGTIWCDSVVACACSCCALGQMTSHVKVARQGSCCRQPDTLPAYESS